MFVCIIYFESRGFKNNSYQTHLAPYPVCELNSFKSNSVISGRDRNIVRYCLIRLQFKIFQKITFFAQISPSKIGLLSSAGDIIWVPVFCDLKVMFCFLSPVSLPVITHLFFFFFLFLYSAEESEMLLLRPHQLFLGCRGMHRQEYSWHIMLRVT